MFFANYNCLVRDVDKDDEPLILLSAFKHGVSENDILHAWREARGPVDINYDRTPTYMYGRVLVIVATPDLPQGGSGDQEPPKRRP